LLYFAFIKLSLLFFDFLDYSPLSFGLPVTLNIDEDTGSMYSSPVLSCVFRPTYIFSRSILVLQLKSLDVLKS
jgi:hypothetical protein